MPKTRKKTDRLEGAELTEHIGHEALVRTAHIMKARNSNEGEVSCGFRFQEEVYVGLLKWNSKDNINLKVWSINAQNGELDLRLDHDFKENL